MREKEREAIDSWGWVLSFPTEISLRMKSPATVGFEQCLPSSTSDFLITRAAPLPESIVTNLTPMCSERKPLQFGDWKKKMKPMELSSESSVLQKLHLLLSWPWRTKQQHSQSKQTDNSCAEEVWSALAVISSLTNKKSFISSRSVHLHSPAAFRFS